MKKFYKIPVAVPSLGKNEKKFVLDCLNTNWISSQGKYVEKFQDCSHQQVYVSNLKKIKITKKL